MKKSVKYCKKCKDIFYNNSSYEDISELQVYCPKCHDYEWIWLGLRTELEIKIMEVEIERGSFNIEEWEKSEYSNYYR